MKKLVLVLCISIAIIGCNDQPLPALVNKGKVCVPSDCSMDYPEPLVYAHSNSNISFPDKHYDSVLGHHDFSIEADH